MTFVKGDNYLKNGLANKLPAAACVEKLQNEKSPRRTLSFYKYVEIKNPREMRDLLFANWSKLGVLGRTYIANEGINSQISVPEKNWETFVQELYANSQFRGVPFKIAVEEPNFSFIKLTVKVRNQIVADGLETGEFDLSKVGKHLSPEQFNAELAKEDTIVVDMRNQYESRIGRFDKAICPDVDTFREELPLVKDLLSDKKDKKILLYCTGGIRCEKASAYLMSHGFEDVNQLEGGIINYAHSVKAGKIESRFRGANFVFDQRGAERITNDVLATCDQCGKTCDSYVNCRNEACNLLFIQCETCATNFEKCCSEKCMEIAKLPENDRRQYRKIHGKHKQEIYKSRLRPKLRA
jgi:UPF0176 protein